MMMKMKPGIYWLLAGAATAFFILPSLAAADKVVVLPLMKHPVDRDRDGYHPPDDCDDSNPDVHPNADWHDTSAGGNVGWDWDCSGGGEKRYPADSDVALLRGTIQCNGYHIMSHDNVVCGYPSIDLKSCEIYWNPLIRPSGACQVRGCESIVLGKDPSQECR